MTGQRHLVGELHAGEEDEREFLPELVENCIFKTSWLTGGGTSGCRCDKQIGKMLDHKPRAGDLETI